MIESLQACVRKRASVWLGCGAAVALLCGTPAQGQDPSETTTPAAPSIVSPSTPAAAPPTVVSPSIRPAARRPGADPRRDAEAKIFAALDSTGDEDWNEISLTDLAAKLEEKYGFRVVVDTRGLDDEGLSGDTVVSVRAKGVRLGDALQWGLDAQNVGFGLRPSLFVLTSAEAAKSGRFVATRVYEVSDLLFEVSGGERREIDPRELAEQLKSTVAAQEWDDVGGHGVMKVVRVENAATLVTSATMSVHEELRRVLADLRAARDAAPAPAAPVRSVDPSRRVP